MTGLFPRPDLTFITDLVQKIMPRSHEAIRDEALEIKDDDSNKTFVDVFASGGGPHMEDSKAMSENNDQQLTLYDRRVEIFKPTHVLMKQGEVSPNPYAQVTIIPESSSIKIVANGDVFVFGCDENAADGLTPLYASALTTGSEEEAVNLVVSKRSFKSIVIMSEAALRHLITLPQLSDNSRAYHQEQIDINLKALDELIASRGMPPDQVAAKLTSITWLIGFGLFPGGIPNKNALAVIFAKLSGDEELPNAPIISALLPQTL